MKSFLLPFAVLIFCVFLSVPNKGFSQLSCIDSALEFNGNNQYVKLAPNEFSGSNFLSKLDSDYTIECLIKWNGGADFQRIFDFSYEGNYFMFLTTSENANHVPRFAISATGLTHPEVLDADMVLTTGVYHHIAITYSKADSLATMFIDGVNVNSAKIDIDADSIYYGSDSHDSSANYIGLSSFAGDPQLNGDIDEFRISDTVRYADDFSPSLPFVPDEHTIALYHFDEGTGQETSDSSGNNYTAQLGSSADEDANDPSRVSCGIVLANSFLSFNAIAAKDQVQLNWKAASDANTHYYEVQRSTDAMHFITLNKVKQIGTSGNYNYSYTDKNPAQGSNYYRIKQVDANGEYSYSKSVYISFNGSAVFKAYPSITNSNLHIVVTKTPSTIVIFNTNGKAVKTFTINNSEQDINISSLPAGNYFIKDITGNASLKFVKE